jgi:hypothetical protein
MTPVRALLVVVALVLAGTACDQLNRPFNTTSSSSSSSSGGGSVTDAGDQPPEAGPAPALSAEPGDIRL